MPGPLPLVLVPAMSRLRVGTKRLGRKGTGRARWVRGIGKVNPQMLGLIMQWIQVGPG